MWYVTAKTKPNWTPALRHLRRVDPVLARMIRKVGPCRLVPRRDYYNLLVIAIFNQQISTRIAKLLYSRFCGKFPRSHPTPARVLQFLQGDGELVKGCGLSRQKTAYLIDLSQKFVERKIPTHRFSRMSDEQVIESLTQVKGIGRWSAEMFLMFVLNRPDVLPVDDLGLREAVKRAYRLDDRPRAKELTELAQKWRPWRTVATWYLWRGLED
jgi:DNA-3-methyladenine glycosylase II